MTAPDLFTQQQANRRRSVWLTAGFVLFFAWIGFGGDLSWYLATRDLPPDLYHHVVPFTGLLTTAIAGGIAWFSWARGPDSVLAATGAAELLEPGTPEERRLVNVVEEMAIASGLPRPRIWIVPDRDPNAFATGRDPDTAHVAVTEGLLLGLNRDELQGVVAHEMAHVKNLDVRLMTLLAAMVGTIALMSDTLQRIYRHGGRGSRSGGRDRGGNPLALVVFLLWLLSLLVAPLVARLLAMAVSRKREYLADALAAQFTRNPDGLASALEKIDGAAGATRSIARGAAHMCIVDPAERRLAARPGLLGDIFASHPPIQLRIERLRAMSYRPV
ncbi:MAG TPA: M48 family metallopeptidase [Gemmatimonadales bacterium]|nr:M48 family metallopeptidase [Gemmatimonadales bacterium]